MISPFAVKVGKHRRNRSMQHVSDGTIEDLVQVFKLLSDETRLRILLQLQRHKELHVRALCDRLGQSQPAISHHLALLHSAGLIRRRRQGKHNYYRLEPQRIQHVLEVLRATMGNGVPQAPSQSQSP